jgi:hypothetical protein
VKETQNRRHQANPFEELSGLHLRRAAVLSCTEQAEEWRFADERAVAPREARAVVEMGKRDPGKRRHRPGRTEDTFSDDPRKFAPIVGVPEIA